MTPLLSADNPPAAAHSPSDFSTTHRVYTDPSRLAPEDAFFANSPPRQRQQRQWEKSANGPLDSPNGSSRGGSNGSPRHSVPTDRHTGLADVDESLMLARRRHSAKPRKRSASRRRKGVWKKLLWVKQSYPDNYTDPPTFLSHLQRNPRLQPYEFWPLVADSTVIVQHVCSVAIFICCFVGIYQEQLSPTSVVGWGSAGAVLGWVLWDTWIGQEEQQARSSMHEPTPSHDPPPATDDNAGDDAASVASTAHSQHAHGLGLTLGGAPSTRAHSRNLSATSLPALNSPIASPTASVHPASSNLYTSHYGAIPQYDAPTPLFSARTQQRLATVKSALLIYAALLGLSPILKSLTKSTTSDSIWAMSAWLMGINVFFFDYSGGGASGAQFPASLSTNAALMASTVLASRLASTTHVFSLTLFSIEVFGLFPVFRRHLRHRSWHLHVILTALLITGSGAGLGVTLVGGRTWTAAVLGIVVWGGGMALAMGGCSWWLIGLQRYKNVVIGPWDPARPIIRAGGWE